MGTKMFKGADKFLVVIVVGALVLVLVAFGVVLLQPAPGYVAEDTPEGVARNYLLALRTKDYARAYDYLSANLRGRPDSVQVFYRDVVGNMWQFGENEETAQKVLSGQVNGARAYIEIQETFYVNRGVFGNSSYDSRFEMRLRLEDGQWKLEAADRYWLDCWGEAEGCPE